MSGWCSHEDTRDFFLPPAKQGGVERCVYELSARFARRGHTVTVATSTRGKESKTISERIGLLQVIRFAEKFHLFEAPLIPAISTVALTAEYDVLHVHGMCPSITDLSILFAKIRRKPVVLTYHNDAESEIWSPVAKLAAFVYSSIVSTLIRATDVVVCSTRSYAETSPALKYSLNKLQVIPMGVDFDRYSRIESLENANSEWNLLFVGQLKEYKGVEVLLKALFILRAEGVLINLDIVGTGPELPKLKSIVRLLHVEDCVHFLENISDHDLMKLYSSCDLVVLPSLNRREAFGIVMLEAMAAGKPVVASNIPGLSEVATMAGGLLAKPKDASSLAASILQSIKNKRRPEVMRYSVKQFTWDKLAARYEEIFCSLLNPATEQIGSTHQLEPIAPQLQSE